jgi:7-cyano-7-deazaguanine reductase
VGQPCAQPYIHQEIMKKSRTSKPIATKTAIAALPTHALATTAAAPLPATHLASFPNPSPQRDYVVRIVVPEFTCLCPLTAQPDFARFEVDFIPDRRNVELKSLKLYFAAYRNLGAFHEAVTNRVLDDLVAAIAPRFLRITARWNVRGGIYTAVTVEHRKRAWKPQVAVDLGGGSSAENGPVPFEAPRS